MTEQTKLQFDKIWLTKMGLWRCNVRYGPDLYSELTDISLLGIMEKLKEIEYNGYRIDFRGHINIR